MSWFYFYGQSRLNFLGISGRNEGLDHLRREVQLIAAWILGYLSLHASSKISYQQKVLLSFLMKEKYSWIPLFTQRWEPSQFVFQLQTKSKHNYTALIGTRLPQIDFDRQYLGEQVNSPRM